MNADPHGPRAHILLVEDDAAIRRGVKEYLVVSGYEVSEAESCAAAQVAFQTARVDVVVSPACQWQVCRGTQVPPRASPI